MPLSEYLGLTAGLFTTFSFIPQVIRVFRLRSAREISLPFLMALLTGAILWLAYGIVLDKISIILWNAIMALFAIVLLITKMKYGRVEPA